MAKSYYAILGISPDASKQEVKDAYRQLAKQYHPDHEGGDSGKFRDIQEAYSVLADAGRRRKYEQKRTQKARRVNVRVSPGRYAEAEPLIPEREPWHAGGRRSRRSFASASGDHGGEDIFEWLLCNLF
ncbi:MAG: DnaJ domain-containing protein [Desulfobacteraceae bacterium]|nr:DnaJ domain-containing protein [Desulfobacteraceae bacterium]